VSRETTIAIAIGAGTWFVNTCWTFVLVRVARREWFEWGRLQGYVDAHSRLTCQTPPRNGR
jgi:hypothetical protein